MLNRLPQLEGQPKEYNLFPAPPDRQKSRRPGQALVFSEKDLPGYKPRTFAWDEIDEEGNPGQGRSFLYERHKRELKRKENKGRFQPYARRPIPKQTAITGVIAKEFEAVPVKNDEFFAMEGRQTAELLKVPEKPQAVFARGDADPSRKHMPFMSMSDKASVMKVSLTWFHHGVWCADWIRMPKREDRLKKIRALHVWRNLSLLTSCWSFSSSTESGAFEI